VTAPGDAAGEPADAAGAPRAGAAGGARAGAAGGARAGAAVRGWSDRVPALLRRPRRVLPLTLPLLALALVGLVVHTGGRHIDLEVYRFGVQAWLAGGDPYGPLPETSGDIALPFIYPPFAALVLLPFAVVPWPVAWAGLLALSVAALAATLYATGRALWPGGGRAGAVSVASIALPLALLVEPGRAVELGTYVPTALGLEPVLQTLEFGQINLLLMALVAVDCLLPRTPWPRGVGIGLAAAIKLTPAAFVLFLLLRGDRRAAATAVATGAGVTALGFLVAPAESTRFWFGNQVGGVSGSPFYSNQTIQAVLVRAGADGVARTAAWLLLVVALLALAVPVIRRAPAPLALVVTAAVALLASPTSWSHHWVWVAPALLVAAVTAWRERSVGWTAATAVTAVVFVVAPHQRALPRAGEVELTWTPLQQVWGSTYVWFTALLVVALWWRYRRGPAGADAAGG
jgi:alpha-1,2-mannosyltransferase